MLLAVSTSGRDAESALGVRSLQLKAAALAREATPESDARKDRTPMNRWNLVYRAVLELAALGAMGTWGFDRGTGISRYVLMAGRWTSGDGRFVSGVGSRQNGRG